MAKAMGEGASSNVGANAFAIFLCSVGAALSVLVVANLGVHAPGPHPAAEHELSPLSLWPILWFLSFILGIVALFWGINGPRPRRRIATVPTKGGTPDDMGPTESPRGRLTEWLRNPSSLASAFLGLALLAASFVALVEIGRLTAVPPPAAERFALVFEPGAHDKAQMQTTAEVGSTENGPGRAILLWSIQGPDSHPRDGILAMFLGCVLTVSFGLFYPRMTLSGSSDTASFIQKMIVPLISLGLFGVGVQQQARANELNEDVELAKRALPPVLFLNRQERMYVLNREYLPSTTVNYLQNSVSAEEENLYNQMSNDNPELATVAEQLRNIREELAKRPIPPTVVPDSKFLQELVASTRRVADATDKNTNAINASLANTNEQLRASRELAVKNAGEEKDRQCTALRTSVANYVISTSNLYQITNRADQKRSQDIFRTIFLALKGEDRGAIAKERKASDGHADSRLQEALRDLQAFCPEAPAAK